ncbi:uncharacterized protein [Physcomitrium patens]|uniref:Uncharacterized protein n=1 Tax=Physcomitrium patens TaxID=3218 RepID=A0A2K1L410_PHYPA|nr:hypothetical protein PHYPA_003546 [Physcomitrium patens]
MDENHSSKKSERPLTSSTIPTCRLPGAPSKAATIRSGVVAFSSSSSCYCCCPEHSVLFPWLTRNGRRERFLRCNYGRDCRVKLRERHRDSGTMLHRLQGSVCC